MRKIIVSLLCLIGLFSSGNSDVNVVSALQDEGVVGAEAISWTAYIRSYNSLRFIDSQGNEERIGLPVDYAHQIRSVGISHDGTLIAYVTTLVNPAEEEAQIRVYDRTTQTLRLEYDLPYNEETIWYLMLDGSVNFSLDDNSLAIGHYNGEADGWRMLVFDLEAGVLTHSLTDTDTPSGTIPAGDNAIILNFEADTVSFVTATNGDYDSYPVAIDDVNYTTHDWHLPTNTFTPNCAYTHLWQSSFIPTGERIEVTHDSVLDRSVLALVDPNPLSSARQVFFESADSELRAPVFVQGGERIVTAIASPDGGNFMYRLILLERDGTVVDEVDVYGSPNMWGTADGFVYIASMDFVNWLIELVYVNTRTETPFSDQSVMWRGKAGDIYSIIWADSTVENPLPEFIPWADLGSLGDSNNCPPDSEKGA